MQNDMGNFATFKRLMLAVDGSEHSQAAARLLAELPCAAHCLVRTVAVLIPRQAHNYGVLESAVEAVDDLGEERPGRPANINLRCGDLPVLPP